MPYLSLLLCAKRSWVYSYVAFYSLSPLFLGFLKPLYLEVLRSIFLVPESSCWLFFIMFEADIMSLGYLLFFIKYWLCRPFYKLAYSNWSEMAINIYVIHLFNFSYLIFFFFSAPIAFLN